MGSSATSRGRNARRARGGPEGAARPEAALRCTRARIRLVGPLRICPKTTRSRASTICNAMSAPRETGATTGASSARGACSQRWCGTEPVDHQHSPGCPASVARRRSSHERARRGSGGCRRRGLCGRRPHRRNGKWFVIEVNSMPAWSGLQRVTRFDLTRRLAVPSAPPSPLGAAPSLRPTFFRHEPGLHRARVQGRLSCGTAGAKTRQCACLCRRPRNDRSDFERSAEVARTPHRASRSTVGQRMLGAVRSTLACVGCNTNLGIVLLAAPLAVAAENCRGDRSAAPRRRSLRPDGRDADCAFEAIRIADPAGLGAVARTTCGQPAESRDRASAGRDRIVARLCARSFETCPASACRAFRARPGGRPGPRDVRRLPRFLAAVPDTHVGRKHGAAVAEAVRVRAGASWPRRRSPGPPGGAAFDAV